MEKNEEMKISGKVKIKKSKGTTLRKTKPRAKVSSSWCSFLLPPSLKKLLLKKNEEMKTTGKSKIKKSKGTTH